MYKFSIDIFTHFSGETFFAETIFSTVESHWLIAATLIDFLMWNTFGILLG